MDQMERMPLAVVVMEVFRMARPLLQNSFTVQVVVQMETPMMPIHPAETAARGAVLFSLEQIRSTSMESSLRMVSLLLDPRVAAARVAAFASKHIKATCK